LYHFWDIATCLRNKVYVTKNDAEQSFQPNTIVELVANTFAFQSL